MFDYPLPLPGPSLYDEVGLPPEAPDQDVRDAFAALRGRLQKEADGLKIQIADAVKAAGGADGDADAAAEARAIAANPAVRGWCDRRDELARTLDTINAAGLDKPEKRAEYDARFPPFPLLKLVPPADPFADGPAVNALVRRGVAAFLAARGAPVAHPTDLTRTDFTADFTPTDALDGA